MSLGQLSATSDPRSDIRRYLKVALSVLGFLVIGLGGLAAVIGINGAVIAPGQVAVASEVKKVQHPTGGVVAEIRVKDGAHVNQGDVLMALDPTQASADVSIVSTAVDQLTARQARLEAERDSRPIQFPPELLARANDPGAAGAMKDELRLYKLRVDSRSGQKSQLKERQAQLRQQIEGYEKEADAKQQQIALIEQELVGVRKLYQQQLVPLTRLNSLERDAVQLRGDVAQLGAAVAEAKGHIAEIELQIIQVDQDGRAQAGSELTDVQNKLAELRQRKVTAEQEYKRVFIRSPQTGVVDRLNVHTIGGVISAGEPIMFIVPDKDRFNVQARVRTSDVDQVHAGEAANVRFSAFNVRKTPELKGQVTNVSAEAHVDEKTGVPYYVAEIDVPSDQLARLHGLKLVAGMPAETFIQTERRTMLSYLTRPLGDQLRRAFREN